MRRQREVVPEPLSIEAFAPFGQAILAPTRPAKKTGEDWDCWFGLGDFSRGKHVVGIVQTRPVPGIIEAMEREPKTEFLLPITGPIIQVVALPGDLADQRLQPDAATCRAFIIRPGQAIIMSPGTWHWAGLPLEDREILYYFVTEPHLPPAGRETSPWVPFQNNVKVHVMGVKS